MLLSLYLLIPDRYIELRRQDVVEDYVILGFIVTQHHYTGYPLRHHQALRCHFGVLGYILLIIAILLLILYIMEYIVS